MISSPIFHAHQRNAVKATVAQFPLKKVLLAGLLGLSYDPAFFKGDFLLIMLKLDFLS